MKIIAKKSFKKVITPDGADFSLESYKEKKTEVITFLNRPDFHFYRDDIVVRFTFVEPVEIRYGMKYFATKTDTVHTVKRVFIRNGEVYYVAGRMKTRGYSASWKFFQYLKLIEVIETQEDYSTQWANIAKSMRKHNINLAVAEAIEKHLEGEADYIIGFQNYWKKTDKPRRMSFKDVLDKEGVTFEDIKKMVTNGIGLNKYGCWRGVKYAKQLFRQGAGRDRSITLSWDVKRNCFTYFSASEYAGCGNGDYYCMYSPTMAFYCETD